VVFVDPDAERLLRLVAFARARLAEVEADYMAARALVDALRAELFRLTRAQYQKRDRLRLVVWYRTKFLEALLAEGEEEADRVAEGFAEARRQSDEAYDEAAQAAAGKVDLSEEQKREIRALWRELVLLFHPDRYADDPERQAVYERLTAAINEARDAGDIATLREIAADPDGFIARQSWLGIGIAQGESTEDLRRLYESIEIAIVERLEALRQLRESAEYELALRCQGRPELLADIAAGQIAALEEEIMRLEIEAARLDAEIEELTGRRSRVRA
jgi:DNA polymerase-3 subunit epsilon